MKIEPTPENIEKIRRVVFGAGRGKVLHDGARWIIADGFVEVSDRDVVRAVAEYLGSGDFADDHLVRTGFNLAIALAEPSATLAETKAPELLTRAHFDAVMAKYVEELRGEIDDAEARAVQTARVRGPMTYR